MQQTQEVMVQVESGNIFLNSRNHFLKGDTDILVDGARLLLYHCILRTDWGVGQNLLQFEVDLTLFLRPLLEKPICDSGEVFVGVIPDRFPVPAGFKLTKRYCPWVGRWLPIDSVPPPPADRVWKCMQAEEWAIDGLLVNSLGSERYSVGYGTHSGPEGKLFPTTAGWIKWVYHKDPAAREAALDRWEMVVEKSDGSFESHMRWLKKSDI
jgi:hypothetical protein